SVLSSSSSSSHVLQETLQDRVGEIEQVLGRCSEKQVQTMDAIESRLEQLEGRIGSSERLTIPGLEEVQARMSTCASAQASFESHLGSLRRRFDEFEPLAEQ
ncbi:unnamed protein product, partial [Polarella glacialis]